MNDYAALTGVLVRRLGLTRAPVAISLLPELPATVALTEPVSFCTMWTNAMGGEVVYATAKEESCGGGAYFMGLTEATPEMTNGVLLSRDLTPAPDAHGCRAHAAGQPENPVRDRRGDGLRAPGEGRFRRRRDPHRLYPGRRDEVCRRRVLRAPAATLAA